MQEYFGVSFPKKWHPLICNLFLFRFGNKLLQDPLWRPDGWPAPNPQPYTGEGRFQHAKHIAEKLLDKDFDWHHWSNDAVEAFSNEVYTAITGCGGCLLGNSRILDPITGKEPTIQELCESGTAPTVMTLYGPEKASVPFVKGKAELFEVRLSNGEKFTATAHHRVLTPSGYSFVGSLSIGQRLFGYVRIPLRSTSGTYLSSHAQDAPCSQKKAEGYRACCRPSFQIAEIEVMSITYAGSRVYYDLTVSRAAHYFAEGAIHHNSGKSTAAALYANLFYLSAPAKSGVIILSTTIDAAKRRIWREVIRLHQALIKSCGANVFGSSTINSPRPSIRCDAKDTVHAMSVVAVGKGQEEEGINILKGFHPKRLLIICDELDSIQQSVVDVCRINLQTGTEEFQFIGLGNPTSRFDPHGKLCEPEQGWDFLDNECDAWTSKSGAKVLRFDGYKSPRIQDGDNAWHGLIRQSDIDNITRLYGADSKYVWTMVRGLWAPDGTDNSIIPESLFIKFHSRDKVTWRDSFTRCSSTDPAFGGDRCVWRRFDYGFDTSNKIKVFFHTPIIIPIRQNDASNPAEYQIASAIRKLNDENEIPATNTILDSTGTGRGVTAILQREYSPHILTCDFGGSPSTLPVSDTNRKPANQEYDRKISELLFSFAEFVKADMVRGLDDDTCIEFATRTFELKGSGQGKRFSVETKSDFKARGNKSPDLMDASAMAVDLLRRRHISPDFQGSATKLKHDNWQQLVSHFDLDSRRTYQDAW